MLNTCIYIFKKGKNKGKKCNLTTELSQKFCVKHIKNPKNNDNTNKNIKTLIDLTNESSLNILKPIIKIPSFEDTLKTKILKLKTSAENKEIIMKHYYNLKRLDSNSTEYYKNQMFVDQSLNYPWDQSFNINDLLTESSNKTLLTYIKHEMDSNIYGMENVKEEILNFVCKLITNPNSKRNNLALHGVAGVGKSKFIKILSDILGLPMRTISLGGIKDSSFFLGHSYVYVESGPGKILQNIIDSKVNNPLIYFDELDKVSETESGADIYSVLTYLTDPTLNHEFTDHYFYGMKFDLSKVFYIFTFNDISKINSILLDRLNIIKINEPTEKEIIEILKNYCLPEILENIGIKYKLTLKKQHYNEIITYFKKTINKNISSGIREYYRILEKLILEINKDILLDKFDLEEITFSENYKFELSDKCFNDYFRKIKSRYDDISQINEFNNMYI
jgi:ATP-dependent Lon protease